MFGLIKVSVFRWCVWFANTLSVQLVSVCRLVCLRCQLVCLVCLRCQCSVGVFGLIKASVFSLCVCFANALSVQLVCLFC